jgi:hypothetical protein
LLHSSHPPPTKSHQPINQRHKRTMSSLADKINEDIIELYGYLVLTTDDQQDRLEYFQEFAVSTRD